MSGEGTNLRNLVELDFDVVAVATNRPSCAGAAFARMKKGTLTVASVPGDQRDFACLIVARSVSNTHCMS